MESEQELLLSLKKGSAIAFESLYKKQYRVVASLITKMGGKQEDAEDIFQETLFVLVKKIRQPGFKLTAQLSTFMHSIARNLWLKKRQKDSKINIAADADIIEFSPAVEDNIASHQEKELMIGVMFDRLNALGKECQKVIRMTFIKKLSHAEVAKELGYTLSFVKVKKFRCLRQLRKMVQESPFFSVGIN